MQKLVVLVRTLGPLRLTVIGAVASLMIGGFAWLMLASNEAGQSLLYADLDMGDASRIIQHLEMAKVAYRLGQDGTAVYVPSDQVARLRVTLAEQGMPSGGSTGYEIFDRADALGSTNFLQNVNLVRALEGELARTIRSIASVKSARIHLVVPRRDLFSRERQEPSASVLLQMRGAARLTAGQVSAVQHLVSTAVPGLSVGRISIVDAQGTLLSSSHEDESGVGPGDGRADERRRQVESRLARTIDQLLERTVGPGKVRAEVSADMDFDLINTSEEIFDPDGQVVRSTQTVDQSGSNSERDATSAVSVATNLPDAANNAGGQTTLSADKHNEETVNYEISKKVINHVREAGIVRRLSVAVLVDGTYTTAADGSRAYNPRPQEELDQLAALVRNAVGFSKERGDTVDIVNMRFAEVEAPTSEDSEPFFGLGRHDIILIAQYVGIFIFSILVLVFVVRPLTHRAVTAIPSPSTLPSAMQGLIGNAGGAPGLAAPDAGLPSAGQHLRLEASGSEEEMINVERIEGRVRASSLKRVGEIVDRHPDGTLAIVRTWLHAEG